MRAVAKKVRKQLQWYRVAVGLDPPVKVIMSASTVKTVWGTDEQHSLGDAEDVMAIIAKGHVQEVVPGWSDWHANEGSLFFFFVRL